MATDVRVMATNIYNVKPNTPINLIVEIGQRQIGSTEVRLDREPHPFDDDVGEVQIGESGEDLTGKILDCVTLVKDFNPATTRTSVTYWLMGGEADKEFRYEATVNEDKGQAWYSIRFILF